MRIDDDNNQIEMFRKMAHECLYNRGFCENSCSFYFGPYSDMKYNPGHCLLQDKGYCGKHINSENIKDHPSAEVMRFCESYKKKGNCFGCILYDADDTLNFCRKVRPYLISYLISIMG
jgi:hypothetical protein